jgi:hypothetical protein
MKTYNYKSYNEYVQSQITGFEKKKNKTWVSEKNIKFLTRYLQAKAPGKESPLYGLCHGVRGGDEQKWFNKYLPNSLTIGTEIGQSKAVNTVICDFNEPRKSFMRKFDFIYSNSFDHAYNPEQTINVWAEQIKSGGFLFIEWSDRHAEEVAGTEKYKMDPFRASITELTACLPIWIQRPSQIIEVLELPQIKHEWQVVIVIQVGK